MSNEKTTNTTEVIIIPNDELHSKDLKIFSKNTGEDNHYPAILADFMLSHDINKTFNNDNLIYYMLANIVEKGYIVLIHFGLDNILEVYFPNLKLDIYGELDNILAKNFQDLESANQLSMLTGELKQLFLFRQELEKKENVRYVFAHNWYDIARTHVYNLELSCRLYNVATRDDAKKHVKVLSYDKPADSRN